MNSFDTKKVMSVLADIIENPKIVITIAAVVFLLDAGLILRWQVVALGRAFGEGKKLKADIAATRKSSKVKGVDKGRLEELRREKEELSKMVVGSQDLPSVLETISKFSEISGVRILRIQPLPGDSKAAGASLPGDLKRQRISISARAGFHQLGRFIALLESAPVFMDTKSIEIQGGNQEYGKQVVTIVLEVLMQKV